MKYIKSFRPAVFLTVLIWANFTSQAMAADCASYAQKMKAMIRTGDLAQAEKNYQVAKEERSCKGGALASLGRMVAYAGFKASYKEGVSAEERERTLKRALEYGRPWQLLASLGDIEKGRKDYAPATEYYQAALDDIADRHYNPKAPKPNVIKSLFDKAQISRMLSTSYVKATKTRSGDAGGLARISYRGFKVQKTALPVQFEYRKTSFTGSGQKAVQDMLDYLVQQSSPDIHLTGHTDDRGSDKTNMKLSLARAGAVKSFLLKGGYKGKIQVSGAGEKKPFDMDDPKSYTEDERWQLDRRVELQRK